MNKKILAIFVSGIWITLSEFIRNELVLKDYWLNHFEGLGLKFDTSALNGFLWFVWSLLLAFIIFRLLSKFSFQETLFLSFILAFLMMWLVLYNLQVFPLQLLVFDAPWGLLETYIAACIIKKIVK